MTNVVPTALALLITLGLFLVLRAGTSRQAQLQAATFFLLAAVILGAILNTHPRGRYLVLQLVLSIIAFVGAVATLVKDRQRTRSQG